LVAPGSQAIATHGGQMMPDARIAGPGLTANDLTQLKNNDPENKMLDKPKAYLNYVFFDKQLNFVEEGSGVKQVDGEAGELETLSSGEVVAKENGYVYVFTSNESNQEVYFDNLAVTQSSGPVLEENHYYPFGLTMSGISTTAPLKIEAKKKFNGIEFNHKEFSDGSGLDLYTAKFRGLDPQIGRWWQIDPRPTDTLSPYAAMNNNPIRYNDPFSDTIILRNDGRIMLNDGIGNRVYVHHFISNTNNFIGQIGGQINANEILENLLAKNIKEAKGIWDPWKFKNYVTDGGKWDLKLRNRTIWRLANDAKTTFIFKGKNMTSQDVGNFHFGAVAKAYGLFPEKFILKQAGVNQMSKLGASLQKWQKYKTIISYKPGIHGMPMKVQEKIMLPPYGDDPIDQYWIQQGFKYFEDNE